MDIWDTGTYHAIETEDPKESEKLLLQGLEEGSIHFVLEGEKLQGIFTLIRMKGRQKGAWLLIKKEDEQPWMMIMIVNHIWNTACT